LFAKLDLFDENDQMCSSARAQNWNYIWHIVMCGVVLLVSSVVRLQYRVSRVNLTSSLTALFNARTCLPIA